MVPTKFISSSLFPLAGFMIQVRAAKLDLFPRQTSPAERFGQALAPSSPAVTAAPQLRRARTDPDLLFARDVGTDTCGYISGTGTWYPLTCGADYTCTNSGDYRGCCQGATCSSSTNYYTSCLDATAPACSASVGPNTLCCTFETSYPYCLTYLWSTTASPGDVFTQYNCDQSTFSGGYFLQAEKPSITSASTSTSDDDDDTTIPSETATSSGSAALIPTSNPQTSDSSRGASIGTIVGGIVGGVAVLGLLVLLAFFLIRKKKSSNTPHMQMQQGDPGPPPGAPTFTDPRYSVFTAHPNPQNNGPLSPMSGYPSPSGSPAPYMNTVGGMAAYNQQSDQEQYSQQGMMQPQQMGSTHAGVKDLYGGSGSPPPRETVVEMSSDNPVGTHGNAAELA
ncbi:uncharacterized protein BCR38DRAFT_145028 [Pseudomassariella vexata]|uniref:Mid2 domain-containing protein n=1 Tax=Pseudomassariella vexata TaxID=1141098 RepID=A0A1Y2D8I2_9PEZI|nr:uncharacterized protein BCR38DRAFT_145028 [Pseudomassariella vexata]ORY54945.1 hypothetical protein BCR38DRAFT_145028 [Pseudomassariella vexata]